MAQSGSEILNSRTGQRTIFLRTAADTGGAYLRTETFHPPHQPAEPEHVHPFQESRCEVLSGKLHFCIAGNERIVGPGQAVDIPRNVPHYFWNDSDEEVHAIQEFRPALKIEDFFDTYFALARAGKLNEKGIPANVFHMAVLIREYDQVMRVTKPPRPVQLLLMGLAPFGRLLGYQGTFR
ncbi:MAG: cupin domain-containing protein [Chloroflexi bacterium]|nr:cupin domain-containing protein [Chloroflexota bacterium]